MNRDEKLKLVVERLKVAKEKLIDLLPTALKQPFEENSFIGGGAIFSLYNGEEPKDYDFFITNQDVVYKLRTYFLTSGGLKLKGNNAKVGDYKGLRLIITDNAISLGDFQIITQWVGTPEHVVSQFDFRHNQFYLYKGNKIKTLTKWNFLEEKKLRYNEERARDICGTIIRTKKFVERGFTLSNREMAKMLLKLHEVGFNDRELEILNYNDSRNNFGS